MQEAVLAQLHREGRWHLESRGPLPGLSAANFLTPIFTFGHLWCLQILSFFLQVVSVIWCHCTKRSQLRAGVWLPPGLDAAWCSTSDCRDRPHSLPSTGLGRRSLLPVARLLRATGHALARSSGLVQVLAESVLLRNQTGLA